MGSSTGNAYGRGLPGALPRKGDDGIALMQFKWNSIFLSIRERLRPWYLRNVYFAVFPSRRPSGFAVSWKCLRAELKPSEDPGSIEARRILKRRPHPESTGKNPDDFLFLPMSDWHSRKQRPQYLIRALTALGHRCFFLNPHLGRQFPGRRDFSPQISEVEPNVFELHVRLALEPVYHHRLLHPGESRLIGEAVEQLRLLAGIGKFIQVVGSPVWGGVAELTRDKSGAPIIYDCHDLIAGLSATHASIAEAEAGLLVRSDLILCSSRALYDHCLEMGASPESCVILRNATWMQPATPRRSDTRRCIGYVGALEDWFDVESIRAAALKHPEWKFLLGGRPESRRLEILRGTTNVEFLGEISAEEVPAFLAELDVATIPFLISELTLAVDPIKLYEYLAAGLPVVSSNLVEIRRFANLVHFYEGPDDFSRALSAALIDNEPERLAERHHAVAGETWEARAHELLHHVDILQRTPRHR